ncbi:MAG: hypothetical protein HFH68_16445 [Lachnospiraceae bacterium]|nr:hypothetical protein [Lachnospiraceae bacterium]
MDKLFEKIYDEVICHEKDISEMNKAIEADNMDILKKLNNKLNDEEEEIFLGLLDDAASSAGRKGFYMGMKYAFKIITALFNLT